MKQFDLKAGLALAAVVGGAAVSMAGNIPQYGFKAERMPSEALTPIEGTVIPCTWQTGIYYLLPNGVETPNSFTSEGYDLGMTFRMGGREVNRFVCDNNGIIYLGKDVITPADAFQIEMMPLMHGMKKADFSYTTTGEEGNRVFCFQIDNALHNEPSKTVGEYQIQFRLYEATQQIVIDFHQVEAPWTADVPMGIGLRGWDDPDCFYLTGNTLNQVSGYTEAVKTPPYMLDRDSYIIWSMDYYDDPFSVRYTFTPYMSQEAPAGSPEGLRVTQTADVLDITCQRDANSPETVILWSPEPFTPADYPVNGETFPVGTRFGNATALYYGKDDNIAVSLPEVEAGKSYYIQAFSATGYPVYGTDNATEVEYRTTQACPTMLTAAAESETSVRLDFRSQYPVIIASTTEREEGWEVGYNGAFGRPDADVQVGDVLEGGGTVIYVGDGENLTASVNKNELTYFRAWTLLDGVVSSTWRDAASAPAPSMPYAPALENYPLGLNIQGWDALEGQFVPYTMMGSKMSVLRAVSIDGEPVSLVSPKLPLTGETNRISLQFALETVREGATGDGGVVLPNGNEPGKFGKTGALRILVNGVEYYSVNQYDGTMTPSSDGWQSGSATMQAVEVEIPAVGEASITIECSTETTSYFFIRDILVNNGSVGVQTVTDAAIGADQPVYSITGVRMPSAENLPAGLYIIGGKKVLVK